MTISRWLETGKFALGAAALTLLFAGCHEPAGEVDAIHLEHGHFSILTPADLGGDVVTLDHETPFRQVGLLFDGELDDRFEYRVEGSAWQPVEVTWSEENHHVGRILLEAQALSVELRGVSSLSNLRAQFYRRVVAAEGVLTRELPRVEPASTPPGAVAPRSVVIPRAEWGARTPDKVCGSAHDPYRMSIHHTYLPADDGGDPAARMRQMQAYHIDSNGWCDIGYHFVASQSGNIYQGRSSEQRTGAHVGGQNTGNVGICYIGDFTSQTPSSTQMQAASEIVGWVHETYSIPLERDVVKGHGEWPGQSTSCPGDNLLAKLPELLDMASDDTMPSDLDVTFRHELVDAEDFHSVGASNGVADVLVGDTFQVEFLVTNGTPDPLRGVFAGYQFDTPYARPTSYTIYTDAPEFDGSSWMVNDSDSAPANPPGDQMGADGELDMYAYASGETKRIVVDFEAAEYSIGNIDPAKIRGWVKNVDGVYAQDAFGQDPQTNRVGEVLAAAAKIDVLSTDEWQFDSDHAEGWTACGSTDAEVTGGALRLTASENVCADSPTWTAIDADAFDQLVVRTASAEAARVTVTSGADDAVTFDLVDGPISVLPLGDTDPWAGEVGSIRLAFDGAVDVDAIFAQSSATNETSSTREPWVDGPVAEVSEGGAIDPGTDEQPDGGGPDGDRELGREYDVRVNEGCSVAGRAGRVPSIMVALLGLFVFARRRQSSHSSTAPRT